MESSKNFMRDTWRPLAAVSYIIVCGFDFIIGPILFNMLQYYSHAQPFVMWQAITLQGGGLYHLSMGAIVGISAYGRTQEKITGTATPIDIQGEIKKAMEDASNVTTK
jgi:hypothetical protein